MWNIFEVNGVREIISMCSNGILFIWSLMFENYIEKKSSGFEILFFEIEKKKDKLKNTHFHSKLKF